MFKKNRKNQDKKDYPPRAGAMYFCKSDGGKKYYKLAVQVSEIEKQQPDENGRVHLIGFVNDYKEKNSHPDVFFKLSEPKGKGKKSGTGFKKKRYQEEAQEEETEEREDESSEEEDDGEIPF